MKIPEFQPNPPNQPAPETASAIGPRRETVGGVMGGPAVYQEVSPSPLPYGEAIQAVDAVEFSRLSLTILGNANSDARVEMLEQSYARGQYSVNAEALARTLLQTLLPDHGPRESLGDPQFPGFA